MSADITAAGACTQTDDSWLLKSRRLSAGKQGNEHEIAETVFRVEQLHTLNALLLRDREPASIVIAEELKSSVQAVSFSQRLPATFAVTRD